MRQPTCSLPHRRKVTLERRQGACDQYLMWQCGSRARPAQRRKRVRMRAVVTGSGSPAGSRKVEGEDRPSTRGA
jgi:hypothetical protein